MNKTIYSPKEIAQRIYRGEDYSLHVVSEELGITLLESLTLLRDDIDLFEKIEYYRDLLLVPEVPYSFDNADRETLYTLSRDILCDLLGQVLDIGTFYMTYGFAEYIGDMCDLHIDGRYEEVIRKYVSEDFLQRVIYFKNEAEARKI